MVTGLPDAGTDPAGFVLAVADLREQRIKTATQGLWEARDGDGDLVAYQMTADGFDDDSVYVLEPGPVSDADLAHIAAEANPDHARAEVALWRGIELRHRVAPPRGPGDDQPMCTWCGDEVCWPCPDFADVLAAARAYQTGAGQ